MPQVEQKVCVAVPVLNRFGVQAQGGYDGSGDQRLSDGSGGAGDVLLQNAAAKCGNPEERQGDDGRRNSSGYGLAGAHAEVRIGCAEYESEEDSETDRFHGHLAGGWVSAVLQSSMVSGQAWKVR